MCVWFAYSSLSVNDWDRTVGRTADRTDSRTEGRWSFTTNSSVLNHKTCQCIKTIAWTYTVLALTLPYRWMIICVVLNVRGCVCRISSVNSTCVNLRMLHRYIHEAHVILLKRVLIHVHLDSMFVIITSHASANQRKRARHCYKACQTREVRAPLYLQR